MKPIEFIAALSGPAVASMAKTGIPASFTVAEGALESGWATSKLAVVGKNLFGVKADASWHGATVSMPTREFVGGQWVMVPALWRSYGDWSSCIDDHAAFLLQNKRYRGCFAYRDGPSFATAVAAAGYATDPNYAALIKQLITQHGLAALDSQKGPLS